MHSYLLFHGLAEIAAATISFSTFLFAWNTHRYQNGFFRVLGTSSLFVALLGILHCLAFPGMPVFAGYDHNLSPQLWLGARAFEAVGLVLGLLLLDRTVRPGWLLVGCGVAFAALLAAIFARVLPRMVLERGLTPAKIAVEWVLAAAFLAAVVLLRRARERFSKRVYRLLVANAVVMAACDICFTLYSRPYDAVNLAGHVLLVAGIALEYQAILRVGLLDPGESHFRALKRTERELECARDRLQRAQAAGRVGTFEWDVRHEEVTITGMETVYGETAAGTSRTYSDWRARLHPEDVDRVEELLRDALEGKAPFDVEYRVVWPDGSVRWVQARGSVERDAEGRAVRMVGVNLDITDHKRAEEALRDADRRKSEFLAVLSHELRNPLATIHNGLFVLERAPEESVRARWARAAVGRQATQLSRLVDDLLDVTRISQGKVRLQRGPVELSELTRRVGQDHAQALASSGLRFQLEVPSRELWIDADAPRIAQVLGNLLANAVKFTPPGGTVRLTLEAEAGVAMLRVHDSGVGIDPAMLPRLFQLFVQAEQTVDRSRGGLGLGLALVRSLVELHDGSVRALSAGRGQGATFEVKLPLTQATLETRFTQPLPAPRRRILVIEDNPDAGDSLRELLTILGHDAHLERSGTAGIEAAERIRPDVVLCDVGLPDLDGYAVARRLRVRGCPLLVALTGYASPTDVARAREAGFHHHLAKPLDMSELNAVLREAGQGGSERSSRPAQLIAK